MICSVLRPEVGGRARTLICAPSLRHWHVRVHVRVHVRDGQLPFDAAMVMGSDLCRHY